MSQNPRGRQDHNRSDEHNERNNARRQNISNPRMSHDNEEDVYRGKGRRDKGSRSWLLSSIDYDRNAE